MQTITGSYKTKRNGFDKQFDRTMTSVQSFDNSMKRLLSFMLLFFASTLIAIGQAEDQTDKLIPQDFKDIFQLAIDHPDIKQYYHIDTDTTRRQIIFQFFGNANHDNLKGVTKFDKQVIIMTENELKQRQVKSYFVVGDWVAGTSSVRLQLSYVIEGLTASYMFKKSNKSWAITNFNLTKE